MLYAFQTRRIFPGAATQGTPEAEFTTPPGVERLSLITSSDQRVAAVFASALKPDGTPDQNAAIRPTLLSFYGNGMCLRYAVEDDLENYRRLGVNVLIPDYLGYGLSTGAPSEHGCYETADAAYDHLRSRPDVDPARIVVLGRSLGGAVAIDLAARREAAGLVTFCTFTRMTEMARLQVPYLPSSLLLKHRFDSLSKIGLVRCPILIGHGTADQLVPCSMSTRLAAAAKSPVTLFTVEGADHRDFFQVGGDQIYGELRSFLARITNTQTHGQLPVRDAS